MIYILLYNPVLQLPSLCYNSSLLAHDNLILFVQINSYFKAMSKGETPPVKERLEMPVATQKTDTGLTPGLLRVLNKQVINFITIFV